MCKVLKGVNGNEKISNYQKKKKCTSITLLHTSGSSTIHPIGCMFFNKFTTIEFLHAASLTYSWGVSWVVSSNPSVEDVHSEACSQTPTTTLPTSPPPASLQELQKLQLEFDRRTVEIFFIFKQLWHRSCSTSHTLFKI